MFGKPSGRFYEFNARAGRRFQNLGKAAGGRSRRQGQVAGAAVSGFQVSGFRFQVSGLGFQLFSRDISRRELTTGRTP